MSQNQLLPLTNAQRNVWFHQQIDPTASGYNIGQSIRFKGELDIERLKIAQQAIVDRFDNLRCRFVVIDNEPFQFIDQSLDIASKIWDLREEIDPAARAKDIIAAEFDQSFNLERDPLCKFGLIRLTNNEWEWFWVTHHIVVDGWGFQVAMQYMAEVYVNPRCAGEGHYVTWAEIVNQSQSYLKSDDYVVDQRYWESSLAGLESIASLSDRPVAMHAPDMPEFCSVLLSRDAYDALGEIAREFGASQFSTILLSILALHFFAHILTDGGESRRHVFDIEFTFYIIFAMFISTILEKRAAKKALQTQANFHKQTT